MSKWFEGLKWAEEVGLTEMPRAGVPSGQVEFLLGALNYLQYRREVLDKLDKRETTDEAPNQVPNP